MSDEDPEPNPFRGGGANGFDWDAMRQVTQLEQENSELKMALQDRERQVESLRGLAEAAGPMTTDELIANEVKGNRISDLAKQNRQLHLALEREKTRASKLTQELARANQVAHKAGQLAPPGPDADPNSVQALARQMVEEASAAAHAAETRADEIKEKYKDAIGRLEKATLSLNQTKMEGDKMRKVLLRETGLGEEVPLQVLLEDAHAWRGRAQQITLLKDKVKDLKANLAAGGAGAGAGGEGSERGSTVGSPVASEAACSVFSSHETAHRTHLKRMDKERRRHMDSAEAELQAARDELAAAKQRADGAAARRSAVEKECRELKLKVQTLIDKTNNDDNLIAALKAELRKAAAQAPKPSSSNASAGGSRGTVPRSGSGRHDSSSSASEALEARCREQELQIQRQEKIIVSLQSTTAQAAGAAHSKESVRALEVEKDKLEELVQLFRHRLEMEEKKGVAAVGQLQEERIKVVELQRQMENSRSTAEPGPRVVRPGSAGDKVGKLEAELLRVSAECHRLQQQSELNKQKYEEELGLYKAMLQQIRQRPRE